MWGVIQDAINKSKDGAMKIGDKVRVVDGNNEIGQINMIGKTGVITDFGSEYLVKGKKTKEVYVTFSSCNHSETHVFNDYHLLFE